MKLSGIYKIINKVTGKYYVGSSQDIHNRWKNHRYNLKRNLHKNLELQCDYNRGYGFEYSVVELVSEDMWEEVYNEYSISGRKVRRVDYYLNNGMMLPAMLLMVEQKYLDIVNESRSNTYQQCFKADGGECSLSTRKKISDSLTGRKLSENHRRKIGESNRNRIVSDETRRKIGEYSKLRKHSDETITKISDGAKCVNHDKNIYKFTHIKTGEVFVGTRNSFRSKYQYSHDGVRNIIRGKYKTYPVWNVIIVTDTV
jgi:hypothetical protein